MSTQRSTVSLQADTSCREDDRHDGQPDDEGLAAHWPFPAPLDSRAEQHLVLRGALVESLSLGLARMPLLQRLRVSLSGLVTPRSSLRGTPDISLVTKLLWGCQGLSNLTELDLSGNQLMDAGEPRLSSGV